jgi:hypothetical protein
MKTMLDRYEQKRIERPGTGCHASLMSKANLGRLAGLSPEQVFADIRAGIPTGGRRVPDSEVRAAITKAWREVDPLTGAAPGRITPRHTAVTPAPFNGALYRAELIRRSAGVTDADLWESSPHRLMDGPETDAATVLRHLYRPDETLYLGDTYGKSVATVAQHLARIEAGRIPPHIILNPLDGEEHETAAGTKSRRCDKAVVVFRFAIVEFDEMPLADQYAFWNSIIVRRLLPVCALVHSGGKSVHAWLRVNLPDAVAWQKEIRDGLYHPQTGRMAMMGADRACSNPSRLSRLPGHFRKDKGQMQRLVYFNPEAGA